MNSNSHSVPEKGNPTFTFRTPAETKELNGKCTSFKLLTLQVLFPSVT